MNATAIYRTRELRQVEADYAQLPLMERAGLAAAHLAREMLGERGARVLVLAGPRNNGGDGFVVARWLAAWFFDVTVAFRGDPAALSADAGAAYRALRAAGGTTVGEIPPDWRGELIVDALFGIGLARAARRRLRALGRMGERGRDARSSPSTCRAGLDADTGAAPGPCILAAKTASFIALKPGLLTGEGPDRCGEVVVLDLDLDLPVPAIGGTLLRWVDLARRLPPVLRRQRRNVHKGSFGTLGIVGGATGMVGAPLLAGRAALYAGAGKTLVGFAAEAAPTLDPAAPELMLRSADAVLAAALDALVCGPGLATGTKSGELVRRALALPLPLLLDADALNLIADDDALAALAAARGAPHAADAAPGRSRPPAAHDGRRGAARSAWRRRGPGEEARRVGGAQGSSARVIAHPDGALRDQRQRQRRTRLGRHRRHAGGVRRRAARPGRPGARGARARRLPARRGGRRPGRRAAIGPLGLTAGELPAAARALLNAGAQTPRAGPV